LITQSLLIADFEAAVDVCLSHGRMAEALVLSIAGGPDLLARTQKAYFDANKTSVDRVSFLLILQHSCLAVPVQWKGTAKIAFTNRNNDNKDAFSYSLILILCGKQMNDMK